LRELQCVDGDIIPIVILDTVLVSVKYLIKMALDVGFRVLIKVGQGISTNFLITLGDCILEKADCSERY